MNYITEIKLFHDWLETHGEMTPAAVLLWYGLMFLTNKAGWRKGVARTNVPDQQGRVEKGSRTADEPHRCLAAAMLLAGCYSLCIIAAPVPRGCNCASQAKKSCSASIQSARQRTGHGRCKYPSTMVFTNVALEAAAGRFSLNILSASRLSDVDLRTRFDCK